MIIWEGYCNTHDLLTVPDVEKLRAEHPDALFVAHPECRPEVWKIADYVGSTTGILKYCRESEHKKFIVATEEGVRYMLELESPDKEFIFASKFLVCPNMKVNNLKKLANALETMQPEIYLPEDVADRARASLERMLQVK